MKSFMTINSVRATIFEVKKSKFVVKDIKGRANQIHFINENFNRLGLEIKINGTRRQIDLFINKLTIDCKLVQSNSYADGKSFNEIYK